MKTEEFRLFLVPTGVAAAVTSEALPLLAARYGWPPQAVETYAANRPGASPGDNACAILTDAAFRVPSARLAAAQHAAGGTVHSYEFGWPTPVRSLGACHALELAFGRDGAPGWRPWTPDDRPVMTFDVTSELTRGPRSDELALWD